ncbi:F-box/LRR-repeat MAX2 homolog A isoform X1 [Ricinus communis]|uniref:F-box/leucine rich repeat protein, putative n=1 Tax=Ricinus communis TaxID=3988 RepID=B9SRD2_RICCO|nr:F-box/LRR-repeat MAX2 homolog A isoform X1 [Ricinus communis]EEF33863.1 F-box/leucine rich repeat protein, putative [Ricinus communis]|eukprot:XP_002528551.1 F-box/LRR-repeat MAX2 homolog A [Ricinus communis]
MTITTTATINDLPDVILSNIIASISDTRTRNSLSLVNRKFLTLERTTRTSLTLRGNARDLYMIPTCFRSVTHLDLSLLSPWGHSLLASSLPSDPLLLAHRLGIAFPLVTSLTVYARSPCTLHVLIPQWPLLSHVKLIRWHQRPSSSQLGADFVPLFEQCKLLSCLDLSSFYYWTEDVPPVLEAYSDVSKSLTCLDLLTVSLTDGFKSDEIKVITAACTNLTKFLVACMFDPSYLGFTGDETLLAVAANCPKLSVLHLVDTSSLGNIRSDPEDEGYSGDDARVSVNGLVDFFSGLPLLEELVLRVCKNVRDSFVALEALNSRCPKLKVLELVQFHGVCMAVESQLDGVALCSGLKSLSIKKCADLTDMGLIEIARGCCRLAKFEVEGCKKITMKGLRTMASLLHKTLVEVKISACKNLDAVASLRALEPIRQRIERLHIDCMWNSLQEEDNYGGNHSFDLNEILFGSDEHEYSSRNKRIKYSKDGFCMQNNGVWSNSWDNLKCLSLWIGVGELLTPLPMAGLEDCPSLEEIQIRVEGDCRGRHKLSQRAFGLSCLAHYPRLSKMQLDCSDTIGFALTAPSGQMDLSLWERFFLNGIGSLSLIELDYWPPQDRDVNQRSLSLPGAGLLAQCLALRKLFIHGTAHEHFMMFLLRIPNLRDVQLREDYYPAPENDMSTEMRVGSCSRFEDALNRRHIVD